MFESWELLVRDGVSHYGTSVPGPSKTTAKAVKDQKSWQWAEWGLCYELMVNQCHGAFQEVIYFTGKPLSFHRKYYYITWVYWFFFSYVVDFLHRTHNNFCIADLIQCTNEMNVNIPQLADSLFERTTNSSWVVVFKSLITTHHLMVYGNEVIQKTHLSENSSRTSFL